MNKRIHELIKHELFLIVLHNIQSMFNALKKSNILKLISLIIETFGLPVYIIQQTFETVHLVSGQVEYFEVAYLGV